MALSTALGLKIAIGLLMVDSIIELSFISSMVAWLHLTASGTFAVKLDGRTFDLAGKPAGLLVDQGHTSNGAAGTAFVLIGLGGILALWLSSRRTGPYGGPSRFSQLVYHAWVALQVPALLLTLGALAYVFAVTNMHRGQAISASTAAGLAPGTPYPLLDWTPQNWFAAVLRLDLADAGVRADIKSHYRVMLGWQYNLIPLFLIQLIETTLALLDFMRRRKETVYAGVDENQMKA